MPLWLKILRTILWIFYVPIEVLILLILVFVVTIPYMIITSPYTLYYYSSNWSLRKKDYPIVTLYLEHFESLYPELMRMVAISYHEAAKKKSSNQSPPAPYKYWPRKTNSKTRYTILTRTTTTRWEYRFSVALFIYLENIGWERRAIWEFLRDKVENSNRVVIREEDKVEFARVLEKVNTHRIYGLNPDPEEPATEWDEPRCTVPAGAKVINVDKTNLDWLLERGAFLVPPARSMILHKLTQWPMWQVVKDDNKASTTGHDAEAHIPAWQYMGPRPPQYPWEDGARPFASLC